MMHTYKAATDVDVVMSTATITSFGNLAITAQQLNCWKPNGSLK